MPSVAHKDEEKQGGRGVWGGWGERAATAALMLRMPTCFVPSLKQDMKYVPREGLASIFGRMSHQSGS